MRSDLDLINFHVEALYTHDDKGRIRLTNVPNGAEAPRFFLGRTAAGNIRRFRHDLPHAVVEQLEAIILREPAADKISREPAQITEYLAALETLSPVQKITTGPAYAFPDKVMRPVAEAVEVTNENAHVLSGGLEDWIPDIQDSPPLMAILSEGQAVAICGSVRITPEAYEAGVETLEAHRGKGYAGDVVAHWAERVRRLGRTPLYSTSWKNVASQHVAKKLGLRQYGVDFHVR